MQSLLEYTVTIENPEIHLARISLSLLNFVPNQIQLTARTIGNYDKPFIKEVAITSQQGRILSGPTFKQGQWSVTLDRERTDNVTITYVVEQLIPDPGGDYESYIGAEYAIIDAETMFLYPRSIPSKSLVRFLGPENWTASAVWEETTANVFSFGDSGELDTFIAYGPFSRRTNEIGTLKATLCVSQGLGSTIDSERTFQVISDLTSHFDEEVFRPLNEKSLLWIAVSAPIKGGGVRDRSFLISGSGGQTSFWEILAHEYIHLWNGRGMNTAQQVRWFDEGATVFLAQKALVDVSAISEKVRNYRLLWDWEQYLVLRRTGQDKAVSAGTLADASILYTKGNLVSLALALTIQDSTKGSKNFYDLTRYLTQTYWGTSVSNEQLLQAANYISGGDLSDFFSRYVYGTDELPLEVRGGSLVLKTTSKADGSQ